MASRTKQVSSWDEPLANVAKAKEFAERFGVHEANPEGYLEPLSKDEADQWDELLKKI